MSNSTETIVHEFTIVSTETSTTIPRGYAVTAWGKLAASPLGVVGVAKWDAEAGQAITVVQGDVFVKFNGTPGTNVELSVHTDGTFDAAVATDVVVGSQLQPVIADEPALGKAWILGGHPTYVKPA